MQQQSSANPDSQDLVYLLDKIEDREYQNVSDVTKAIGLVEKCNNNSCHQKVNVQ